MSSTLDAPAHLPALTPLRGLAAMTVVLHHFTWRLLPGTGEIVAGWSNLLVDGFLCVDFFFLLSGFLLAHLYAGRWRGVGYTAFLRARIARIYPLHLVTLLAVAVPVAASPLARDLNVPSGAGLQSFLENLFLVQAPLRYQTTWNQPAWTISAEVIAYALFPVLLMFWRFRRRAAHWAVPLIVLAALVWLERRSGSLNIGGRWGVVRCVVEFSLGMWLAHLHRLLGPGTARWANSAVLVGVIGAGLVMHDPRLPDVIAIPFFSVVIVAAVRCRSWLAQLFANRWFERFGAISYSIYLWHWVLMSVALAILAASGIQPADLGGGAAAFAILAGMLAIVVLIADLSYRWIEVPARTWIRGR